MIESFEEALLRIEGELLSKRSVGGWLASLDRVLALGNDPLVVRAAVEKIAPPTMRAALEAAMGDALRTSIATSARLIHPAVSGSTAAAKALATTSLQSFRLSSDLTDLAAAFDARALQALSQAVLTARTGGDVDSILAPLREQKAATRRAVTRVVNQAANEATRHAAAAADLPVVWVAERNACVRCLAYSGIVAHGGEKFPGGLTYASYGAATPPLHAPPLHHFCRCHLEPLKDQSYADALRREADRSVLRGFALPSESRSTRIDAAKTLLESGVQAPKSVIAFAKKSIKNGDFGTPNATPGGPAHNFTPKG